MAHFKIEGEAEGDGQIQKFSFHTNPDHVEKIAEELRGLDDGVDWGKYIAESLVIRKQTEY